jgi:DNA-binding YbaB/EbfC family protein
MSMKELQKLFKQAKKMQNDMAQEQEKLQANVYEGSAGGGMVIAKVNGKMELVSIAINRECIDPDDPEMLCDMVKGAVNEALRKAHESAEQSMSALTSGLKIPGL